jgi:hypothetical protein
LSVSEVFANNISNLYPQLPIIVVGDELCRKEGLFVNPVVTVCWDRHCHPARQHCNFDIQAFKSRELEPRQTFLVGSVR